MRRNPEFLRNFWLEITPHRLVATPLILGAFYYLILFSGDHNESFLLLVSLWIFILSAGFWGATQAENSIVTEIQNKTWPLQRLTSINPWTMAWGKLFGSTLFSWYAGLWSLLVFALTWLLAPEVTIFPRPDRKWILLSHGIGPAILFMVGLTLWFQASGFLMGMYSLQTKESKGKRKYGRAAIISLIFLPGLITLFQPVKMSHDFHWFQWEFNQFWFGLVSLYIFLGWLMTGIYMQMRRELQVSNPPWVWAAFMLFLLGYVMGFIQGKGGIAPSDPNLWVIRLFSGWILMVGLTYLILLWERVDGVDIHRLFHLWNSNRIHDALCEIPRWLVGLIVTWATVVTLIMVQAGYGANPFSFDTTLKTLSGIKSLTDSGESFNLYGFVIAAMCFLMRDIALLLYFYFSDKPQRALATAFVYWLVLYLLIPLLLGVVWMEALNSVFLPNGSVNFAYAVLPPLLQAGLMWTYTLRRWRTRFGSPVV